MSPNELGARYRKYIDCINGRRFNDILDFTEDNLIYNDKRKTKFEYRDLLIEDCDIIPDLHFTIGLLVVEGEHVGARLDFNCTPEKEFLGLKPNGKAVSFSEHVFYRFRDGKIAQVWSLIDRQAITEQLAR